MNTKFNGTIVETNGVRSIAGGGTSASTATGALANLGGVSLSGNQTIDDNKNFLNRPTVNGTGVALQGEFQNNTIISGVVYSAQVNVKNDHTGILYKGQPVYIKGASGGNILVGPASNTGEATSSKTLGLIYQDSLAVNASGTVITDGLLSSFDVGSASAGDPIWLGPTGNLIYGLTNKPAAPNHLVYLGVVTRTNNNGEVFVKVQNGFELDELHDVGVKNSSAGQVLFKDATNQWIGKNLEISNVSGLQSSLDDKLSLSGGTISGKLILPASVADAPLNFQTPGGSNPSSPQAGDVWISLDRIRYNDSSGINRIVATTSQSNSFTVPQVISTSGATAALRVEQRGEGYALWVEDETTPDSSAFIVDSNGRVSIGTTPDATAALKIDSGGIKFADDSLQNTAGMTHNTLSFWHSSSSTTSNNLYYFSNLPLGPSTVRSNRIVTVNENCVAKSASWSHYMGTTGNAVYATTGYFINLTKNTTGIINTGISGTAPGQSYNFTGMINPPIQVSAGDQVNIGWNVPGYLTQPTSVYNAVDIYFYSK